MMTSELLRTAERALEAVAASSPQEVAKDVREIEVSLTYPLEHEGGWTEIIRFPKHSEGKTKKISVTFEGMLVHAALDEFKVLGQHISDIIYTVDLEISLLNARGHLTDVTPDILEKIKRGPWLLQEVDYNYNSYRDYTDVIYRCANHTFTLSHGRRWRSVFKK
jgi:hypothetical protein